MSLHIRVSHGDAIHYWDFHYDREKEEVALDGSLCRRIDEIRCVALTDFQRKDETSTTYKVTKEFSVKPGDIVEMFLGSDKSGTPSYSGGRVESIVCKTHAKSSGFLPFVQVSWLLPDGAFSLDSRLYSARSINGKV